MRLQLFLEAPDVVPFDYLPTLVGAFHRWAGHDPARHDGLSLYSLAWLHGGRAGRQCRGQRGTYRAPDSAEGNSGTHYRGVAGTARLSSRRRA